MAQAGVKTDGDNTERLQEDLAALRKDFGLLTEHVRQLANDATNDAAHGLAERGARLRQAAASAASAAKQKGQANIAAFEGQVQAHPFAAVLIAFGVGVAVSRLISRD